MESERAYPFLAYQKNSFLRMIRNTDYVPKPAGAPLLYRKPPEICEPVGSTLPLFWQDKLGFSREWRLQIERYINAARLKLKLISDMDTPKVKAFLSRRYPTELANEICAFDLFRFRNYGHGLVMEDDTQQIRGTLFEVGYDTAEKTSFTIRLAVEEGLTGHNLGYHLMMYSALLAMEQGSRVKRGLIQFENVQSLYINLNKVGWLCDKFDPNITDMGSFFHIALPLDPAGMTSNIIAPAKIPSYLLHRKEGIDYRLVSTEDLQGVSRMYEQTDFKIVAVLRQGEISESPQLLALPARTLQLETLRNQA